MNINRKILAAGAAIALMGLSTTAFADNFGPINRQQYAVSAQETLRPLFFMPQVKVAKQSYAAPKVSAQNGIGSLIGAADPHWGPAFDPDVE
ncbi:hypothetical protein [Azorhizobium sp. AG788]|uniref:hypothetical protein n=1 Tax=Azorhizobium sp. AG788 TaxID=2183897 RepID=UPI00313A27C7